jgi:rubrerythrin
MAEVPNMGRRWIPEGGLGKHNERIHKGSKIADSKNLPFTFSKPKRESSAYFECEECGRTFASGKNTVMVICPVCKKLTKARKI